MPYTTCQGTPCSFSRCGASVAVLNSCVIGAGHDDAVYTSVIGRPENIIGHLDVLFLVEKVLQWMRTAAAFVAEMYHRVHALKVSGILASIGVNQVEHDDVLDLLALAI